MATANTTVCRRCRSPVAGNLIFCKNCGAPVVQTTAKQAAAQGGSPPPAKPPQAQHPPVRPTKPPAAAQTAGSGQTALLTCKNCGGRLQYSPGAKVVRCLYCGSDSLIRTPGGSAGEGTGENDGPPGYYEPKVSAAKIRDAILKKAAATPASLKTLDQVSMKIEGCYFPAWAARLKVHCNWSGENHEYHAVTKYREERKCIGQRWNERTKSMEDHYERLSVPYTDTEEISHPTSGMHDYETKILVPAAKGVTPEQFDLMLRGTSGMTMMSGPPPPLAGFPVASPTFKSADAWRTFSGDALLERDAQGACSGYCGRIIKVGPVVNSRRFSLVWLPMAVVSYVVQWQEYRHVASLITGEFSGDIPADWSAVKEEALKAKAEIAKLRKTNVALGLCLFGLAGLCGPAAVHFLHPFIESFDMDTFDLNLGGLFFGCCIAAFGSIFLGIGLLREVITSPWVTFLRKHYAFLARFFLDPPKALKQRMYEGYPPAELDKLRAGLRDALECNFANEWLWSRANKEGFSGLEAIVTRAADVLIDQPATEKPYELNLYAVKGRGCTTDFDEARRWQEEAAAWGARP